MLEKLQSFARRMSWLQEHRPDLTCNVTHMCAGGKRDRQLLSIVDEARLRRILSVMLDEKEFLSPYGLRSMSAYHRENPFVFEAKGSKYVVDYEPAESTTGLFGGNSNWRGPIWFPLNYLIIESLQKYHHFFGESFKVECPTGSGRKLTLGQVAIELSHRLSRLFLRDQNGFRPAYTGKRSRQDDPNWRDGRALEVLRVHRFRVLHVDVRVSDLRQLGVGRRLAVATRFELRPWSRPR